MNERIETNERITEPTNQPTNERTTKERTCGFWRSPFEITTRVKKPLTL